MAAVFVDEVKDLPAQLLDFQLDRRDVTHDMRLVLVRYGLEASGTFSAKQGSIRILLVSSSGWQAGNRKRMLRPLPVGRAMAKAGAFAYAAAQIFAFERPSQPRNISKPGGIMEMTMMARITKE